MYGTMLLFVRGEQGKQESDKNNNNVRLQYGGGLLIARGGDQGAFSRHQGQGAHKNQNTTINGILCLALFWSPPFSSTISTTTTIHNTSRIVNYSFPAAHQHV